MTRRCTILSVCLVSLWVTGLHGPAQAQTQQNLSDPALSPIPPVIALLPFNGAEAAVPPHKPISPTATAEALMETLRSRPGRAAEKYKVLPPDEWTHVARRKFHGRTTEVQGIAKVLGAGLVIGGWVEANNDTDALSPYRLTIALYNNWAEPLGQISYDVDTPRIEPQRLLQQATTLFQLVDRALGLEPPPEKPAPYRPVTQAEDDELAPLRLQPVKGPGKGAPFVPPNSEATALYYRRPPWRPLFDLRVGYLYNIRHFTDNGSGREFNVSGTSGLLLHGELYPLAAQLFGNSVQSPLAGLGVRLTVQLPFWPDISEINQSGQLTGLLTAKEYRIDVGFLRWHWNFWDATMRPDVDVEALYGYHRFDLADKNNVIVEDIPAVAYSYLGASLGAKMHFTRRLSARLGFAFAGLLDLGPIAQPGAPGDDPMQANRAYHVYGPGSGWLWRMDVNVAVRVVRGFTLGLGFYYEQTRLSFDGTGDVLLCPPCNDSQQKPTSATDEYGGIFLTAGYVY